MGTDFIYLSLGGFKYFLFSPLAAEMIQIEEHTTHGWQKNHQLDLHLVDFFGDPISPVLNGRR